MAEKSNVDKLEQLYKIVKPQDVTGRYDLKKFGSKADPSVIGEMLGIFVNTVDSSGSGLLTYNEIVGELNRLLSKSDKPDDIKKNIRLFGVKKPTDGLEYFPGSWEEVIGNGAAKANVEMSVIALRTPMLGMSLRDVNKVSTFLNAIPSVELSRCIPLLEVKFETAFPGEDGGSDEDGSFASKLSAKSPTLLRYLNGNESAYKSADRKMAKGSLRKVDLSHTTNAKNLKEAWKNSSYIASGMEIFTSPQTLISPERSARIVPVIDQFAPLMSIESFEITATPSGAATIAYKTARLMITVHDRSRLHEVASLLKPDAYSRTTVSITYGWSHPDSTGANPIGDLINQMIVRDEKFNIVNSSFTMAGTGAAKVTLQLATKGASDMATVRIVDSPEYENLNATLQSLSDSIREMREKLGLSKPSNISKDVRVFQIIDAAADNAELVDGFAAKKDMLELRKLAESLKSSAKAKDDKGKVKQINELFDNLDKFLNSAQDRNAFFSKDGKDRNKKFSVDALLGEKFRMMTGHQDNGTFAASADPFLDPTAAYWKDSDSDFRGAVEDVKKIVEGKYKKPRKYVSFAKLMAYYVGMPLQSIMSSGSEVQFVYYPFNSDAGLAGVTKDQPVSTSIASFPVDIEYFTDVMADHAKRKGNANITVREFVQLLNSTVLEDVRSWAYGLRSFYKDRSGQKDKVATPELKSGSKVEDVNAKMIQKLGGVFKKPTVEILVEARGGRPLKNGDTQEEKSDLRIIRIHVYDKQSSSYEPTLQLLHAQQGLQDVSEKNFTGAGASALINVAQQIGLNLQNGKFNDFESVKRFISQVVPTLTYGANTSGILAATLQTMQNPQLATVNMQRAMGPQYNSEPNGSGVSALPLRVQPSQLDLTLVGCPLLNLAQQFFIDFNTGTTLDNLYVVTHLSHVIAAGKFQSTAKLTYLDAYGAYESIYSKVEQIKDQLKEFVEATKKIPS